MSGMKVNRCRTVAGPPGSSPHERAHWPPARERVLGALPATVQELADGLGLSAGYVSVVLRGLRKDGAAEPGELVSPGPKDRRAVRQWVCKK